MKSFLQFITEAPRTSRAVEQARRLGFVSDGHGNWYDREGNYRGHTEKGELVLSQKRGPKKVEDPRQKPAGHEPSAPERSPKLVQGGQTGTPTPPEEEGGDKKNKGTATIAFGRFNPPHAGHGQLISVAKSNSEKGDFKIYPSRKSGDKKNPLEADEKISIMRQMFSDDGEKIVNDGDMKTIFDVLKKTYEDGYSSVNIVAGGQRVAEFDQLAKKYNGELYDFEDINVISAGDRDPDAEGIEGISASKMRAAVKDDDFESFMQNLEKQEKGNKVKIVNDEVGKSIFNAVKKSLGKKAVKESLWQIAPKLDWQGLRENFFLKKIFNVGDLIENDNTGLRGRIVRRGTNYLISVTESGMMFKSWIGDVSEAYTEVKMDRKIRDKEGHPNNLVGTTGYFKNVEDKTPGATVKTFKNFLNKYRKK